jgi:hypothetical protein
VPDAMQSKELLEEIGDPRFGTLADQLIGTEPVDLISGEAQLSIGRDHLGIHLQRRTVVLRARSTRRRAPTREGRWS